MCRPLYRTVLKGWVDNSFIDSNKSACHSDCALRFASLDSAANNSSRLLILLLSAVRYGNNYTLQSHQYYCVHKFNLSVCTYWIHFIINSVCRIVDQQRDRNDDTNLLEERTTQTSMHKKLEWFAQPLKLLQAALVSAVWNLHVVSYCLLTCFLI